MKHLEKLRARLKEIAAALKAFDEKDALSADEVKTIGELTAECEKIEGEIKTLEDAEKARARLATPANEKVEPAQRAPAAPAQKLVPAEKIGLLACAMLRAYTDEGLRGYKATLRALDEMGYGEIAKEFEAAQFNGSKQRTLSSANATAGGVLLPENMSTDMLDILRPNTTFMQGNPIIVPMPNGTFKQPAAASGSTASYRGETKPASVSQPTFKSISMSAKLLAGIVPVSNQLLRWNVTGLRGWVERDLSAAMGTTMDSALFRGAGGVDSPLGITNISGVYRVAAVNATAPTVAQVEADAAKLELRMENANLPLLSVEWRMSPRVIKYLENMRDGNGNRIYPELQGENPRWRRRPVRVTTQIPSNLGAGTNESEIYLVAFGHVMFGDSMAIQLAISDVATVVNGSQTINAFQDGVTLIKAEAEHDVDIRFFEAVAVLTEVKWGA